MKYTILGFEFEARLSPTTNTMIGYRRFQEKIRHTKCKLLHNISWIPKTMCGTDCRWYCCNQCHASWLVPIK
jgi:hypothetical protein